MSDIESGLKEAIASAQASRGRAHNARVESHTLPEHPAAYAGARVGNGESTTRPPLTAPQVIETIMELTKQAHALDSLAWELSDALAGGADKVPFVSPPANEPAMSIFDRMGLGLLELTRTIESIDRNVKRSLGAVKP